MYRMSLHLLTIKFVWIACRCMWHLTFNLLTCNLLTFNLLTPEKSGYG
jgi:hypothetical protein